MKHILYILFFLSTLFSNDSLDLKKRYYFKSDIYAKDLTPNIEKNFLVMKIRKPKTTFNLLSNEIIYEYKKHGFKLNSKFRYVKFVYEMSYDRERIINHIRDLYLNKYREINIKIEDINITPTLYRDLTGFSIKKIIFKDILLKRPKGTFSVLFTRAKDRIKIYFKYDIKATLDVFKVSKKIMAGESVTSINTNKLTVKFKNMFYVPIPAKKIGKVSARHILPIGKIITEKDLGKKFLVKINQRVVANILEGGVNVKFLALSMGNGDLGDKVRIRMKNKKILEATIIGVAKVEVR